MKDNGPQPTQSTTVVQSPEQQELLNAAMPGLRQFAATVPKRYAGPTVAGFDPLQTQGQQDVLGAVPAIQRLADTGSNTLIDAAQTGATTFTPNLRDNSSVNPSDRLNNYITASTRPISQNFQETVLPGIRGEAVTTGNFGSSRQGIAEGLAAGRESQAIGDTAAKLSGEAYGTDVNQAERNYEANLNADQAAASLNQQARDAAVRARLSALGLLPTVTGLQTAPGTTESGVGDVRQMLAQAGINADVAGYNFDQFAPFLQSQELLSVLQGLPGGTTVSTGNNPATGPTATTALGGAASGAALGTMLFPGVGTAAGAIGGAALPFIFPQR